MAESGQELYERVTASWDDGQLARAMETLQSWGTFPFEAEGLRVAALEPPELPEPDRQGEGGRDCGACARSGADDRDEREVWRDDTWRLVVLPAGGAALALMLQPLAHHDLTDLPDELARELGVLQVQLARAVEALPNVARCHVLRFGDGGAHLHVFFMARIAGVQQLRGSFLLVWDDLLPPTPDEIARTDAATVAASLVRTYGGVSAAQM